MLKAPVVASTVPVTDEATEATLGSPRILAARSWTAVLPSCWTGSGSVTGAVFVPDELDVRRLLDQGRRLVLRGLDLGVGERGGDRDDDADDDGQLSAPKRGEKLLEGQWTLASGRKRRGYRG